MWDFVFLDPFQSLHSTLPTKEVMKIKFKQNNKNIFLYYEMSADYEPQEFFGLDNFLLFEYT